MSDSEIVVQDAKSAPADGTARSETRLPRALRILLLATPFVLFLGILAGIEVTVRATLPHVSTLSLFVSSPLQQDGFIDSQNVTIFEGDPLLFWRVRPSLDRVIWDFTVVSTNEQGLRHAGPIEPKRDGSRRIVTLVSASRVALPNSGFLDTEKPILIMRPKTAARRSSSVPFSPMDYRDGSPSRPKKAKFSVPLSRNPLTGMPVRVF